MVLRGARWADFQRFLTMRGDHSAPRLAYSDGLLEIMSPSRNHEAIKSVLGRLVETYCLQADIEFSAYGSWTLEDKRVTKGIEPDECYVFGPARDAKRPDLAIEVVWTSGGINKLEIYKALKVREVWFWQRGAITPYVLRAGSYRQVTNSEVLPTIVLRDLVRFLDRDTTSQAIRAYRKHLARRH